MSLVGEGGHGSVQIEVDRGSCMSAGECLFSAREVFAADDEGKSVVIDPTGLPLSRVIDAARCCPNFAISVVVDGVRKV